MISFGTARVASAQSAPVQSDASSTPAPAKTVVLLEGSAGTESAAFLGAVRDHLGDLGVRVLAVSPGDAPANLVTTVRAARKAAMREHAECTVWIDLPRPGEIVLYLLEPQTPILWTRKLRVRDETPAASVERVGLIARWAVAALLEGQQVDMASDPDTVAMATVDNAPPPERPPQPPATKVPAPLHLRGSLGAAYTGEVFSSQVAWESGLALFAKWRFDAGLVVGAGYRIMPAASVETPAASARVSRHPAELFVGYQSASAPFLWFGELGAILDYTVRSTRTVTTAYEPEPDRARLAAGSVARAGAGFRLAPRIWLTASTGLDVFFGNASYVVEGAPAGTSTNPWAVRPRADVGIAVFLW
jgi:hypothetical protein